jgi:hypothetical protein
MRKPRDQSQVNPLLSPFSITAIAVKRIIKRASIAELFDGWGHTEDVRCLQDRRITMIPGERNMLSRITLALALAITAFTMIVPASAAPGDAPYPSGYQDGAYNRTGW